MKTFKEGKKKNLTKKKKLIKKAVPVSHVDDFSTVKTAETR